MKGSPLVLVFWVCGLAATAMAIDGCAAGNPGNPGNLGNLGNRQLESLSISPENYTANGSAVQFTATGHWSMTPITVTPQSATWGACTVVDPTPTNDVTVSTTGMAACASGATGTYTVFAWDPDYGYTGPVCNAITACGGGCGRVSATAQLTCP